MAYILCPTCKFKTLSDYALCKHCGTPLPGASQPTQLLALNYQSGPAPSRGQGSVPLESNLLSPIVLTQGVTSIGRMADNLIVLPGTQVSRHHAVIRRDQSGAYLVEDLQSTNGTFLNGARISAATTVNVGDSLKIGGTELRFDQGPSPAGDRSGKPLRPEKTYISLPKPPAASTSSITSIADTIWSGKVNSENFRPLAREEWALKHLKAENGDDYFILKGLDHPGYLRLTERDVFIWKLMDGRHTLRDILVAYFQAYRAIGTDRLIDLMYELTENDFLQNTESAQPSQPRGAFETSLAVVRRIYGAFLDKQFSIQGADDLITRIYKKLGWPFYTRIGQLILAAVALAGLAAFAIILLRGGQTLFVVGGSAALGIIVLALANIISIFLHELAHALTVKSYNRHVHRVGFMIYFGMPAFFVDTSDIWMEPKAPRIQTSLAGPYVNLLVGSLASLVMVAGPAPLIGDLLFQLAALSYLTVFFNLNPLLELDGYFVLMDWLEVPLLRKRSLEFVQHRLWGKLRGRETFSKDEKLFSVFGILSAFWSLVAIGIFFLYTGPRMVGLFQGDPEAMVTAISIVALLVLLGLVGLLIRRLRPGDPSQS